MEIPYRFASEFQFISSVIGEAALSGILLMRQGGPMTDHPLTAYFLFTGGALLFAIVVLTLDWFARRRQHREK